VNEFEAELRARRFVQEVEISALPVDLAHYVAKIDGKVLLDDLDPDEAGYTMTTPRGPVITLNAQDRAARRRFTQCHEIAHVVLGLPSQHAHGPEWSYARRPPEEICCDVFAAEILLPYKLFAAKAAGLRLDFASVHRLAGECFASREAVASRLVATSRVPCAYVLSEKGFVRHAIRSPSMRSVNGWIASGTALPEDSAAHALRAQGAGDGSLTCDGDLWFEGWRDVQIEESSIFLPDYDQTLTLLHCTDPDELDAMSRYSNSRVEPSDPEYELLAPLDGHLSFGSKHRRR
jgi:Zn-dependent peptidase ImmA (M78 family)